MTLEQAKQGTDILQKINFINEIIDNLLTEKTLEVQFNKGPFLKSFVVPDEKIIDLIVDNFIIHLKAEIFELTKELERL